MICTDRGWQRWVLLNKCVTCPKSQDRVKLNACRWHHHGGHKLIDGDLQRLNGGRHWTIPLVMRLWQWLLSHCWDRIFRAKMLNISERTSSVSPSLLWHIRSISCVSLYISGALGVLLVCSMRGKGNEWQKDGTLYVHVWVTCCCDCLGSDVLSHRSLGSPKFRAWGKDLGAGGLFGIWCPEAGERECREWRRKV